MDFNTTLEGGLSPKFPLRFKSKAAAESYKERIINKMKTYIGFKERGTRVGNKTLEELKRTCGTGNFKSRETMKTRIKQTKDMGRGVFANQTFRKGDVVEVSPCISWNEDTNDHVQDSELRFYVFDNEVVGSRLSVLALGVGSLFNHGGKLDRNVSYKYDAVKNQMVFKALRKIKKNEQLLIDYGYNPVDQYKTWTIRKLHAKEQNEFLGRKILKDIQHQEGEVRCLSLNE